MKKLLLFLGIVLSNFVFGQSITIDPTTSSTACSGQNITVNFTPSGGATGPFTVELIEKDFRTSIYSTSECNGTRFNTKSSVSTTSNFATISIPSNLNTSFDPNYGCGYGGNPYYPTLFYAYRNIDYFFRITGSNGVSNDKYINLSSTCTPTLGVALAPMSICAGKTGNINWFSVGANNGNVFTVEMSDQNGSFTSPTLLGTLSSNNTDGNKTLAVTIPSNSISGSYKIKVKSSDPISEKTFNFSVKSLSLCGAIQEVTLPTPLCSEAASVVSYTLDDIFQSGNVFTVELSNQSGSFTSPTIIGSITSQTATSTPVTIPSNLPFGDYLVRIVASLPSSGSPYTSPNSNNITIGLPVPSISGFSVACENSFFSFGISTDNYDPEGQYNFIWKKNSSNINGNNQSTDVYTYSESFRRNFAQASDAGNYSISIQRKSDGCEVSSTNFNVTINAGPPAPSTVPVTVLSGNSAILSASNCTGTVWWYKDQTVDNSSYLSSSNTYSTPELTQQTTYYAACRQSTGNQCWSARSPLVVSIDATNAPAPPTLTASDNNYCYGSVANTVLTATGCTGIVRWYYKSGTNYNFDETDIQAPYEKTTNPSTNLIYQADCRENGILSTSRSAFEIIVKPVPNSPGFDNSYLSINSGSDVAINMYYNYCLGGTIKWFDASSSGNLLFTGRTYSQTNVTNSFQIYANCTLNGCEGSRNGANVNVSSSINAPNIYTETPTICGSGSATLSAIGCSNGTVNWFTYSNSTSTYTNIGSGQTYTTPALNFSGTNSSISYQYYADCTIGANTSNKNYKSISVYQTPPTPAFIQSTIACNTSASLSSTNCTNNFYVRWYETPTSTNTIYEYNGFNTPNLNASTTYYVECWNNNSGTCKSPRVPITVIVGCTPPDAPVVSSNLTTICSGEGINLSATGCTNTVNWSDGGTGATRNYVIFNNSIVLTATCNNGLESANSNSISITVNLTPSLNITNPASVSPPNTVNITQASVTAGSILHGAILSYHSDASGNVALTNPPASAINVSGTYYIKALTSAGCADIQPVVVVISDCGTSVVLQSPTDDYSSGTTLKKTNETILANNKITGNANVVYRSNKSITLDPGTLGNPGFKAEAGVVFKAEIAGCN